LSGRNGSAITTVPESETDAALSLFGDGLPLAQAYAQLLAQVATVRGLLGPREVPRLWERHLLNCAGVAALVPARCTLIDLGSGAGLPGLVLAIARPDLQVTLLDSMLRRTAFLHEAVAALGLADRVRVVRARAEEHRGRYDVVTARAAGPLPTVARWGAPLCQAGGLLLAIRGAQAGTELAAAGPELAAAGWGEPRLTECGSMLSTPTTVIRAARQGSVRR